MPKPTTQSIVSFMLTEIKSKYLRQFILLSLITWILLLLSTPFAEASETEGEGIGIKVTIDSGIDAPSEPVSEFPFRQQEDPKETKGLLAITGPKLSFLIPAGILVALGFFLISLARNYKRSEN